MVGGSLRLLSIFRNMPSIYYTGTGAKGWRSKFKRLSDNTVKFYMLPPIKYPVGGSLLVLQLLSTLKLVAMI
jgi:hypothetical protein